MRVFLLGHRGMLGHVTSRWLRECGHEVLFSELRYEGHPLDPLINAVIASGCDAVVNCAAITRPATDSSHELFVANSLLPQHLAASLGPGRVFVHASTDGVFDGARGRYRADEPPNATDPYGLSKRLGELCLEAGRVVVLRTSIVGPEAGEPKYLLGWLLSKRRVAGSIDRLWNGITTLAWAGVCERAVRGEIGPGVHHPCSPESLSKHALLVAIAEAYEHDVAVDAQESSSRLDRTLVPTIAMPPIANQLRELKKWYQNLGQR